MKGTIMTFKGKKIIEPTLEMFCEHIERKHLPADPLYCYKYYKARDWKNSNGRRIKSVEIMIGALNSLFINGRTPRKITETGEYEKRMSYEEQLKDKRWLSFRRFIFDVRGSKCEKCGSTTHLQVHHNHYIKGRSAWEYTCNDVMVVCRKCHRKIHRIK